MLEIVWFLFKYSEHLCQRQIQTVLLPTHAPSLGSTAQQRQPRCCGLRSDKLPDSWSLRKMSALFAKTCFLLSSCQLLFQNKWNLKISLFVLFKVSAGCSSGGQKVPMLIYPCAAALGIFNLLRLWHDDWLSFLILLWRCCWRAMHHLIMCIKTETSK